MHSIEWLCCRWPEIWGGSPLRKLCRFVRHGH